MRATMVCVLAAILSAGAESAIPQRASLIGKPAPKLVRPDLTGKRIDLDDFRGKVVLLNFWATWCGPCRVELPRFAGWQDRYGGEGLQVIAVSMDDDSALVGRTARQLHLNFPVVMGDEKLGMTYGGVLGLPVTYLIDREGKIVARFGGESDLNAMEDKVRSLLSQG